MLVRATHGLIIVEIGSRKGAKCALIRQYKGLSRKMICDGAYIEIRLIFISYRIMY